MLSQLRFYLVSQHTVCQSVCWRERTAGGLAGKGWWTKSVIDGRATLLLWDFLQLKPQHSRCESTLHLQLALLEEVFAQSLSKNLKGWITGQSRKNWEKPFLNCSAVKWIGWICKNLEMGGSSPIPLLLQGSVPKASLRQPKAQPRAQSRSSALRWSLLCTSLE